MSYQVCLEEMIGKHVACFQTELTLAKQMLDYRDHPVMPHGYPQGVYRPRHACQLPMYREYVAKTGGCLSNGVPRVLRNEWLNGTLLGIYNPKSLTG